jgi:hypothetical protein
MDTHHMIQWFAALAALLPLAACVVDAEGGHPIENETDAIVSQNSLDIEVLQENRLTRSGVADVPLTAQGLSSGAVADALRQDPMSRAILPFIARCALPRSTRFSVQAGGSAIAVSGELGLAPRWGQSAGSCGERCQQVVSACLMAKVNHQHNTVNISLRGAGLTASGDPGDADSEVALFPRPEATYFGNVFQSRQQRFMCIFGDGKTHRICGTNDPTTEECGITVLGTCDECTGFGQDSGYTSCRQGAKTFAPLTVFTKQR